MTAINETPAASRHRHQTAFLRRINKLFLKRLVQFSYKFPAVRKLQPSGDLGFTLKLADGRTRRFAHRGSRADICVMHDIFVAEDYRLSLLARYAELSAIYDSIVASGKTPLIVDCGSNIGASMVYFASNYAKAHVVGFEPNPDNFRLATKNTQGLNVEVHQAAIGSTAGSVSMVDPGFGEWGFQTVADSSGSCPKLAISDIIRSKEAQGCVPFVAKIDIEGGEADLFEEPNDWVDAFPIMIVELHDAVMPRQRTSHPFLRSLLKHDRDLCTLGPNLASMKNKH